MKTRLFTPDSITKLEENEIFVFWIKCTWQPRWRSGEVGC